MERPIIPVAPILRSTASVASSDNTHSAPGTGADRPMAQITSSVGLISGIDTGAIINDLISIDAQPATQLQLQIDAANAQQTAFNDISTKLTGLQTIAENLALPATFSATTAQSSDPNVLTATTSAGASPGTYQFQVVNLVTSQQSITQGFASPDSLVGAGTLSLSLGGGDLDQPTALDSLNGGEGVSRGEFRITDAAGQSTVISIANAVNLDDVINDINNAQGISVQASIGANNNLVLTDTSGGTGSLTVADVSGGTTAESLGIAGTAAPTTQTTGSTSTTSPPTLAGSSINYLSTDTALSTLKDNLGLETATNGGDDMQVTLGDGTQFDVSLAGDNTIGDVINSINTASNGKLDASVNATTNGLTLTDKSGGGGTLSLTALNGSNALSDLGLTTTASGGAINGTSLLSGIDTTNLSTLNGGAGLKLGTLSITNAAGQSASIDLSGAQTVQDVINDISNSGIDIAASINAAGDGIQVSDNSGGSGNLVIADGTTPAGATAAATALGLAGTYAPGNQTVQGADLHPQWVNANTQLSTYNAGTGVTAGSFTITNAAGEEATVNIDPTQQKTIGDVIAAINSTNIGVDASINATGNGLLLTDTSTGAGHLTVADTTGSAAEDLGISGTATANTIDGSLEKTIQITSGDTLTTVQQKLQKAGINVAANIVNDGGTNGYHLEISSVSAGTAGRIVINGGTTGLQTRSLVEAENANVFVGGSGNTNPLLVTSNTDNVTNLIPGVTVNLLATSSSPVTLSVTNDSSAISTDLTNYTNQFNTLVTEIQALSSYNTTTNQGGLLLGDPTTQQVLQNLYAVFSTQVKGAGSYQNLESIGLTVGDNGQLSFDSKTFDAAYSADPKSVSNLFSQATTGLGTVMNNALTQLVDPVSGIITEENQTLTNQVQSYQTQLNNLDALLADKRNLLEEQFANMETTLAQLQSQGNALSSLSGKTTTTSSPTSAAPTSSGSSNSSTSSTPTTSSTGSTSSTDTTGTGSTGSSSSTDSSSSGSTDSSSSSDSTGSTGSTSTS
jgi:flagellar hook-associated protein 2